jgi:protein arginine kinase activator
MVCEMCKQNEATVHIVKIVNGFKQELNICEKCAQASQKNQIGSNFKLENNFTFQSLLSGLVDYLNQSCESTKEKNICEICGTTYAEFKETGLVGCNNCYQEFKDTLNPVIQRVQKNTEHVGKIPVRCGEDIIEKRKIGHLKEELQKAISSEEYEKAAQIRDMIKDIQREKGV